jgi:hypothetical protein
MKFLIISLIVLIEVALATQNPAKDVRWRHFVHLNRKQYKNESEEAMRLVDDFFIFLL